MKFRLWLLWMAAVLAAGCSCAEKKAQELSAYWNGHDFTTLDAFEDIDAAEDKFDGFIDLLSQVPYETAVAEMTKFLDSASQNVVAYMVWSSWFEPFLHAKESPYRNDDLFVAWLDKVLEDKVIDDGSQMEHLALMRKCMDVNRAGMAPQELSVRSDSGEEMMLSDFKGEHTLLLFVDADCPSCLQALSENVKENPDVKLVAVLVNAWDYHLANIRRQLPEEVLQQWTLVTVSMHALEEGLYDTSLLPFRMLVNPEWIIEKSYF